MWWGQRAHWEKKKMTISTEDKEMHSTDPEQIISLKHTANGIHTHTHLILWWALTISNIKTNEPVHTQTPMYTQTPITIYLLKQRNENKMLTKKASCTSQVLFVKWRMKIKLWWPKEKYILGSEPEQPVATGYVIGAVPLLQSLGHRVLSRNAGMYAKTLSGPQQACPTNLKCKFISETNLKTAPMIQTMPIETMDD